MYELLVEQEEQLRTELVRLARREEPVRRFQELPGFGWIRSITFYVYIDTPARFPSKSALWRYCGIGLERRHSGGGPLQVRLTRAGNRRLKDVLLGAAKSAAVSGDNPFADKYVYWTQEEGIHPSTARRNVARSLASTLWSLWKTGSQYDPTLVRGSGRPSRPHTKLTSPGAGGGVPWVPLSFELQPVNEPTALKSDARSDIRIDLARESPIGAWATFLPTITHPRGEQRTQPRVRNDEPTHRSPPPEGTRTRHATTRRPSPARRCKNGQPPTVRLDSGLPIGGTLRGCSPNSRRTFQAWRQAISWSGRRIDVMDGRWGAIRWRVATKREIMSCLRVNWCVARAIG